MLQLMSLIVQEFGLADVSPANGLTNLFVRDTHVHFGSEPATDGEFLEAWRRLQPRYPWLSAADDDQFAGYAKAAPWRERDAYRFTVETTVYIRPEYQRRGVGRALMLELLTRLSDAGFRTAIAGIALPNSGSVVLHERLGFEPIGIFPAVGFKFDRAWDVGFWLKRLGGE